MPQGTYTPWAYEHVEILKEWLSKYPKGKSINLSQIKFSDPDRFQAIQDAGHNPQSMQDKAYAIMSRTKPKAAPPSTSKSERATMLVGGKYKCNECGEIIEKKQLLPHHYAKYHGGKKPGSPLKVKVPAPITSIPTVSTALNSWHYCPNCAFPLDH